MRFSIKAWTPTQFAQFLTGADLAALSYQPIYQTCQTKGAKGYNWDDETFVVGKGEKAFEQAKYFLKNWQHFPEWTYLHHDSQPVAVNQPIVMGFRLVGIWWYNRCRVVYEFETKNQYGFAYGTLPEHVEKGEELFELSLLPNEEVMYRIRAMSHPQHWLAYLSYPFARYMQAKFRRDSANLLKKRLSKHT